MSKYNEFVSDFLFFLKTKQKHARVEMSKKKTLNLIIIEFVDNTYSLVKFVNKMFITKFYRRNKKYASNYQQSSVGKYLLVKIHL